MSTKDTPVLFLVFNRPETTREVLVRIRSAAPRRLYIAADGPRPANSRDAERCAEVLALFERGVDWPCKTEWLKRDTNLGCRRAVSSALTWFFENEEEGIILEDDCLPAEGFFPFCSDLLQRYRGENRIGHIGGFNCQFGRIRGEASYYFSRYFHVWGWATWRRAWQGYDPQMASFPQFIADGTLDRLFHRKTLREYWRDNFAVTFSGRLDTWDYQWVFHNFRNDRLAIVPNFNMITNIGFGQDATHTAAGSRKIPPLAAETPVELTHPDHIAPDEAADDFTYRNHLGLGLWHSAKQVAKGAIAHGGRARLS
ncbi:MAG: nucleotide-diphospho-sugar transferase [Spirochaetia bacterium]|jgi:hypothetical protein